MKYLSDLCFKMIEYYKNDPKRIHHFFSVHTIARYIAENEHVDEHTLFIIEAASYIHDIGIKVSEEKYHSTSGYYQEIEGEVLARNLLESLDFNKDDINRICYLVAHHHHYDNIDSIDYQILVEADFLVNFYGDEMSKENILKVYNDIFKTKTAKFICENMYLAK